MTTKAKPIPVIFRVYEGELCAYFPSLAWGRDYTITCYAHVGQHGGASPEWLSKGRLAKPEEYKDLLAELRDIYETNDDQHVALRVASRSHPAYRAACQAQRREWRRQA